MGKSRMSSTGWIIEETRKYFIFKLESGRMVGTKAETMEKAKLHIEQTLDIELLQEAA